MRVLVVHVRYQLPGGEDLVFESETRLLRECGIDGRALELSNASIQADTTFEKLSVGLNTVWSRTGYQRVCQAIKDQRPDLVHFHNTFPLLSPSAYFACAALKVPCIQTLHNYRLLCANAMLLRNSVPCESCLDGRFVRAIGYRCYKDSRSATAAVVAMQYAHRGLGTYMNKVARYIALTDFAKSRFVRAGFPPHKISVKPNCLVDTPVEGQGNGDYIVFVGRLSHEKGVDTLLKAWEQLPDVSLKVLGDGPLRLTLEHQARRMGLAVEFLGHVDRATAMELIGAARCLVIPSEWYEGFPMTVLEAYSKGTPVIASNIGSLTEIVDDGVTGRKFTPGDANELALAVKGLYYNEQLLQVLRANCRQRFIDRYTGTKNIESLIEIYNGVLATS